MHCGTGKFIFFAVISGRNGTFFFVEKEDFVHNFFEHRQNCGRSAHLGVYVMSIFNAVEESKKKSSHNQLQKVWFIPSKSD